MHRYLATIKYSHTDNYSRTFDDVGSAKSWLDAHNHNAEYTTIITEMDEKWNVIDWFYYTESK